MLNGFLSHVLHPFTRGKHGKGKNQQLRAEEVVLRWSRRLCLLPQVDDVTVIALDGDFSILVLVSPETPEYGRFIGIPARIEGFPTIVKIRSALQARTGD